MLSALKGMVNVTLVRAVHKVGGKDENNNTSSHRGDTLMPSALVCMSAV